MISRVKHAPKVLQLLVLILIGGLLAGYGSDVQAEQKFESRLIDSIPGKYALIEVIGDFSDTTEEQFEAYFQPLYDQYANGVDNVQIAFFQTGSRYGTDIQIAALETFDKGVTVDAFLISALKTDEKRLIFKDGLGYTAKIKRLATEYSENELVAYETYNNREMLVKGEITDIKVSVSGPQIILDGDEFGLGGLKVTLNTNDAFIRKVKKGSHVYVRLRIRSYLMGQLQAEGRIFGVK